MRLVFVTQTIEADDPVLGATVAKLRALAARCESLHVLALTVGAHDLPANVTFSTFGAATRGARGLRYARALASALRPRPAAIVAHMCPIYLVLAAPLAKPVRVPLLLWYTHWHADRTLRWADRLADAALSVDRSSYPLPSDKVRAIGHGIDTSAFVAAEARARGDGPLRLLALGRTSPTKGLATLVDGLALAVADGLDATLELRGTSTTDAEREYRAELEQIVEARSLAGRVRLEPPVPRSQVPGLLAGADALLNAHVGTLDKAVYEAAACGVPVVARERGFAPLLDGLSLSLRFADPAELARVLGSLAAAGPESRAEVGRALRRRVEASHSVETWADGVVRVVAGLRPARAGVAAPSEGHAE